MKSAFNHHSGETISIDGADIYFEEAGTRSGPPLLCLHGGVGSLDDFGKLVPALADYRLIGIDSRGHGRSTFGDAPLTYARLEKDTERIVAELALDSFSILGFSDGGILGYRLASRMGARIQKLVTIGARWRMLENDPTRKTLGAMTGQKWLEKFPSAADRYAELNPGGDFDRLVSACVQMWLDLGPEGHPGEQVREITAETLVIRGDQDHLLALNEAVELRSRLRHGQYFNVPAAGHAAHEDQPKLVQLATHEFLSKI